MASGYLAGQRRAPWYACVCVFVCFGKGSEPRNLGSVPHLVLCSYGHLDLSLQIHSSNKPSLSTCSGSALVRWTLQRVTVS